MSEISSAARKSRRAACWTRGEKRKAERRQAQTKRAEANRALREMGLWTPWQYAQCVREAKRFADPQVQARRAYWNRVRGVSAA